MARRYKTEVYVKIVGSLVTPHKLAGNIPAVRGLPTYLTVYAQYGAICQFLLRKEVVKQHDFDGGFEGVSAEFEMFLIQLIMFLWGILNESNECVKVSMRCFRVMRFDATVTNLFAPLLLNVVDQTS